MLVEIITFNILLLPPSACILFTLLVFTQMYIYIDFTKIF